MKIIGQPADYSEILKRVFYTTAVSGILCTVVLAYASSSVKEFLDSISTEADIGPFKGFKALYVLVPLIIASISRIGKLHDRISDIFSIRYRFDTRYILFPMVRGVGLGLTKSLKKKIERNRVLTMYDVFYAYAGFKKPVIDEQLVRTAADNWGWFWVLIESSALFLVTSVILGFMKRWDYMFWCLGVVFAELIGVLALWFACRRCGLRQVDAILANPSRMSKIAGHFTNL